MKKANSFENVSAGAIDLSGVVLFSAKSVFAKMAFEYRVDPISVLYMRMLFSFPLLLAIGFIYEKTRKHTWVNWKDLLKVAAISVLGYYLSAVFNFEGLVYIDASLERLILFIYPTLVIFLSAVFLSKPITIKQIAAIAISYAGLLIAFSEKLGLNSGSGFYIGVSLILLSSVTYAVFLTVSDSLIQRVGSVRFSTTATLTMCICMMIHALIAGKASFTGYHHNVYLYCSLMAVLSTVIPVYLFNFSMSKLGATNLSVISSLGPIATLLLSALLLKEQITGIQLMGTSVVIIGISMIHWEKGDKLMKKITFTFFVKKNVKDFDKACKKNPFKDLENMPYK
jgi:drug/metabolite transporter (DMT)-like permease